MSNQYFDAFLREFSQFEEVDAILLAGSRANQTNDEHSDYDVYVYLNRELPVEKRKRVTDATCSYMELNNQYWETEDDGVLLNGTPIELIYRGFDWLDGELERVMLHHQARTGYTTCFWANLLSSAILYDPKGKAKTLQDKYRIPYPQALKRNIIAKNYPLLKEKMPAYYFQIKKAVQRGDLVSVNHRLTEFLASYFDILFAINEYPHPGEKRLLTFAKTRCAKLPEAFERNITTLLHCVGKGGSGMLAEIEATVAHLDALLKQEQLFPGAAA